MKIKLDPNWLRTAPPVQKAILQWERPKHPIFTEGKSQATDEPVESQEPPKRRRRRK